ncbi:MAG TPA: hypothetical protein VHE35_03285 [Kofleriaceae bacterium]|nr:hypothetical protein [Kofleriaceae bacterium]
MIKDQFIDLFGSFVNLATIQSVIVDDDGNVRIYVDMINSDDPSRPSFWSYDGENAARIKAFFAANSQKV